MPKWEIGSCLGHVLKVCDPIFYFTLYFIIFSNKKLYTSPITIENICFVLSYKIIKVIKKKKKKARNYIP